MKKPLFLLAALAFAGAALAQQYKWVDKDGKVRYGDVPPPGVKATPLRAPAGPAPSPAADSKGAKDKGGKASGPLTPAQQEAEYRKRQIEAQKAQEKEAKAAEEERNRRENCQTAQDHLRVVESGQRMSRVDAKGERVFLDDDQRAAEGVRARKAVSDWCK